MNREGKREKERERERERQRQRQRETETERERERERVALLHPCFKFQTICKTRINCFGQTVR